MGGNAGIRDLKRAEWRMLLAATLLSPLATQAATIHFDFAADVGKAPGEVLLHKEELNVAPTGGLVSRSYDVNANGALPLSTVASINLDATAKWSALGPKSIGVKAVIDANISAYDINNPPPPHVGVIEASSKAHVESVVTIAAPGAAANAAVTFNLLNPALHGALNTPTTEVDGTGLASIHGLFLMFEYSTDFFGNQVLGAGKAKSFEIIASTETIPTFDFSQSPVQPLERVPLPGELPPPPPPPVGNGNPDFTVLNGKQYLMVVEFYAAVNLSPKINTDSGAASNRISSASWFDSTLHWGGFGGFADASGLALPDVQVLDEEGVDWATRSSSYPVPLPPSLLMLLTGVAGVARLATRRRITPAA